MNQYEADPRTKINASKLKLKDFSKEVSIVKMIIDSKRDNNHKESFES
jgi:hypothetical protein